MKFWAYPEPCVSTSENDLTYCIWNSWTGFLSVAFFLVKNEKEVLALLSKLDLQHVNFVQSPPGMILNTSLFINVGPTFINVGVLSLVLIDNAKQSVHLVAREGLEAYIPLADMVDISAELQRLAKRLSKMQAEYDALVARLDSPSVWNYLMHFSQRKITCIYVTYICAWKLDWDRSRIINVFILGHFLSSAFRLNPCMCLDLQNVQIIWVFFWCSS